MGGKGCCPSDAYPATGAPILVPGRASGGPTAQSVLRPTLCWSAEERRVGEGSADPAQSHLTAALTPTSAQTLTSRGLKTTWSDLRPRPRIGEPQCPATPERRLPRQKSLSAVPVRNTQCREKKAFEKRKASNKTRSPQDSEKKERESVLAFVPPKSSLDSWMVS